ncbi:LysM peptidoglycan-binding domain-containing protein [Enterococcus faecium]|uniref:aggregation-promoting factor n=1 Tax=Enterococcus faecium TaxID=1352 RepID=UPI003D09E977
MSQKYVGDNSLINAIAESNSISDINLIYSGQQLTIPTEGSAQVAAEPQAAVQEAPVQTEPVQAEQPVVQETVQTETQAAPAVTETAATPASTSSAKEWIAQKESSGSYTATNGRYIGRYQLDSSYLNGDYSAANQERVAEQYVTSRYGSWEAAKAFWEANGWY